MTLSQTNTAPANGLPDPLRQAEFYDSVPTKRLIAWFLDGLIILGLTLLTLPFTLFLGLLFLMPLYAVIGFAYRVVTLSTGSATLGMRLVAIQMRQQSGHRFDLGTAFLHTLGFYVSFAIPLIQVASIVLMLTSARGQGLTDHVLGTTALNRRR